MADIVINGEKFSGNDSEISFLGRVNVQATELNYTESQDVAGVKVLGNRKSVGHIRSNYDVKGDITLLYAEVMGLQKANRGTILNLAAFPMTVTTIKEGIVVKETIKSVVFTEVGKAFKSGSSDALMCKCNFWASEVETFK